MDCPSFSSLNPSSREIRRGGRFRGWVRLASGPGSLRWSTIAHHENPTPPCVSRSSPGHRGCSKRTHNPQAGGSSPPRPTKSPGQVAFSFGPSACCYPGPPQHPKTGQLACPSDGRGTAASRPNPRREPGSPGPSPRCGPAWRGSGPRAEVEDLKPRLGHASPVVLGDEGSHPKSEAKPVFHLTTEGPDPSRHSFTARASPRRR
jgi:hypothetical protein